MHEEAAKWDRLYHNVVEKHEVENGKFLPKNRPCDWCGQPVEKGYIHKECWKKEASFFLDLIY